MRYVRGHLIKVHLCPTVRSRGFAERASGWLSCAKLLFSAAKHALLTQYLSWRSRAHRRAVLVAYAARSAADAGSLSDRALELVGIVEQLTGTLAGELCEFAALSA